MNRITSPPRAGRPWEAFELARANLRDLRPSLASVLHPDAAPWLEAFRPWIFHSGSAALFALDVIQRDENGDDHDGYRWAG